MSLLSRCWIASILVLTVLHPAFGDDSGQCEDPDEGWIPKNAGTLGRALIAVTFLADQALSVVLETWFFFIAWLMLLHRHVFDLLGYQTIRLVWVMGRSIIILHFWMREGHLFGPFIDSCFLAFLDQFIIWLIVQILKETGSCKRRCTSTSTRRKLYFDIHKKRYFDIYEKTRSADSDEESEKKCEANNVYQDLRRPLRRAIFTAVGQMGLLMYYMFELNGLNKGEDEDDNIYLRMIDPKCPSLVKWLLAVFITEIVSEDDVGKIFDEDTFYFWKSVFSRLERIADSHRFDHRKHRNLLPIEWHFYLRVFMDLLINSGMFTMIMVTAPIMLSVEQPLDYVKDVTAVFFILKLDDIDDPVDLTDETTWKGWVKTKRAFHWVYHQGDGGYAPLGGQRVHTVR